MIVKKKKSFADVLQNFTKFTGKHLCQSLFFSKVAGLRPATLLKKRLWHRCFPVNFVELFRTTFLKEYLRWLLLVKTTKCYPGNDNFTLVNDNKTLVLTLPS